MRGFCGLTLIGSHSEVCRSGLNRAHTALENMNIKIPQRKIVLSVVPADLKTDGNQFDLPFAVSVAVLVTKKQPVVDLSQWLFAAEISLDGTLRPIRGAISVALSAMAAGLKGIMLSFENATELQAIADLPAQSITPIQIFGAKHLKEVLAWIFEDASEKGARPQLLKPKQRVITKKKLPNFDDMLLTKSLFKLALVVAVGQHSLCLYGTPGTGKSMFAHRLPSILPAMQADDLIVALRIHSSCLSRLSHEILLGVPPFRSPHHQTSAQALLGVPETPGEISLAYGGILFLDELPEFRRDLIESLREPLETGVVQVSRARRKVSWQAKTVLVAASNNCPCGWLGSAKRKCYCPTAKVLAYKRKLSGPILDRIDLHVNMQENSSQKTALVVQAVDKKDQTDILARQAQEIQTRAARRNRMFGVYYNRELNLGHLVQLSKRSSKELGFMIDKYTNSCLSSRGSLRLLRVARTLADIEKRDEILEQDIQQALSWNHESAAIERGDQAFGLV